MHRLTKLTEFTMCTTIGERPLSLCGAGIFIMKAIAVNMKVGSSLAVMSTLIKTKLEGFEEFEGTFSRV